MADAERDATGFNLRRCAQHVYQDVHEEDIRHWSKYKPPLVNELTSPIPQRLQYLQVNENLPRALTAKKEVSSPELRAETESRPVQEHETACEVRIEDTGSVEEREVIGPTSSDECRPRRAQEQIISSSPQEVFANRSAARRRSSSPGPLGETVSRAVQECKTTRAAAVEDSRPREITGPVSASECRPFDAQERERFSHPPEVVDSRSAGPAPVDEQRAERTSPSPNEFDENPTASPASIDESRYFDASSRRPSDASQAEEERSPNLPEFDESLAASTSQAEELVDESCRVSLAWVDENRTCNAQPQAGEKTFSEIDASRIASSASVDESRSSHRAQEEDGTTEPPEFDGQRSGSPATIDESRSYNNSPAQAEEMTSSYPLEASSASVEDARSDISVELTSVDESQRVSYESRHLIFSYVLETQEDERTYSTRLTDENDTRDSSPGGDVSRWSNPPQASCSSFAEEEAWELNKSTRSTSGRRRPGRDHFVSGYVVRERKPNRHVPVLSTYSSKDDDGSQASSEFDIQDEVGEVGQVHDTFWPQPGDVLVLQKHRSGITYPGFDGHVELYVDESYFDNPDSTWNWAYGFDDGDILIRFGRFLPNWKWSQEDSVQVYLRYGDCFILVGRESNHELYPIDFKFSDPALSPIHSIRHDFQPRDGDLIVRKDLAKPFTWTLFWWKEAIYVSKPFDMLVRASFANSDDRIHCFGVAEVYFRNAKNQYWSFQGRDDYTFGGGL